MRWRLVHGDKKKMCSLKLFPLPSIGFTPRIYWSSGAMMLIVSFFSVCLGLELNTIRIFVFFSHSYMRGVSATRGHNVWSATITIITNSNNKHNAHINSIRLPYPLLMGPRKSEKLSIQIERSRRHSWSLISMDSAESNEYTRNL